MIKYFLLIILCTSSVQAQSDKALLELRQCINHALQQEIKAMNVPIVTKQGMIIERGNFIRTLNRFNKRHRNTRSVGFQPVITTLPSGIYMPVGVVVSGDRRYVRIGLTPFFSTVGHVDTFNFGR